MLYYKYKLVRFTGVPLKGGVWRLIKTNSGLKQNNVPQGWARNSGKTVERPSFTDVILLCQNEICAIWQFRRDGQRVKRLGLSCHGNRMA